MQSQHNPQQDTHGASWVSNARTVGTRIPKPKTGHNNTAQSRSIRFIYTPSKAERLIPDEDEREIYLYHHDPMHDLI